MSAAIVEVGYALYFILPAYAANATPVVLGGGRPIDCGRKFRDGKPIFGANKTFRGFFLGLAVGTLVSLGLNFVLKYHVLLGFMTSLGALVGDLVKSFIKRRLNLAPGESLPLADQLDFVFGALLFSLPVSSPSPLTALIIILVTPPIHFLTNLLANVVKSRKRSGERRVS